MSKLKLFFLLVIIISLGGAGCGSFGGSYENASQMDRSGMSRQAIQAYKDYLKAHSATELAAHIHYRIAKNFEALSEYDIALDEYEKVISDYPDSDEALHALLDTAGLYRDKLKNPDKTSEYYQKALKLYLDNARIHDAIEFLVDAQYQSATAYYTQKNYKGAQDQAQAIFQSYPSAMISPDRRAKVESLMDRARRALNIGADDAVLIMLKNEIPFNKSYEGDFPPDSPPDPAGVLSPDRNLIVSHRITPSRVKYLYLGKINEKKMGKVSFTLIPQTFGADLPNWSQDNQELVYRQTVRGLRKLEKTGINKMNSQTLFFTRSNSLGLHPVYHPAGNKIAYVYEGKVWLINSNGTNKTWLKTIQQLDYTAELAWSTDGTMIRCRQVERNGKKVDELLVLDVASNGL